MKKKILDIDAETVDTLIKKKAQYTKKLSDGWARLFFKKNVERNKTSAEDK